LEELAQFPFTTRAELIEDQTNCLPLGANLSCPRYMFKRLYRSSGTTQAPIFWADTTESWDWVMGCSQALYLLAEVQSGDRLFFALPFGLSSGPWIMFDGACRLGCGCAAAGTAAPEEQVLYLQRFQPSVLVGRPLALRSLAIACAVTEIEARDIGIEKLILTGEFVPPELRAQLESLWDAECFNRYGLTEAGPVAGECCAHSGGMHLLEREFVAEVINPDTAQPVADGEHGELVLTTLGRFSRPIIRYRTGDLVHLVRQHQCACGRREALLMGGVRRKQIAQPPRDAIQRARAQHLSPGDSPLSKRSDLAALGRRRLT
jgi:phenylacetate-CoA ligase